MTSCKTPRSWTSLPVLGLGLLSLALPASSLAAGFGSAIGKSIRSSIDNVVTSASRRTQAGLADASQRLQTSFDGVRESARKLKPREVEFAKREGGEIIPGTRNPLNEIDGRALAFRERHGLVPRNPEIRIGAEDALPRRAVVAGQTERILHTRLGLGRSQWFSRNGREFTSHISSKNGRAIQGLYKDYGHLKPGQWSRPITLANGSRIQVHGAGANRLVVRDMASQTTSTYKIGNPGAWMNPQVSRHMTLAELKKLSGHSQLPLRTQGFTRSSIGGAADMPTPVYTGVYRPEVVGSRNLLGAMD